MRQYIEPMTSQPDADPIARHRARHSTRRRAAVRESFERVLRSSRNTLSAWRRAAGGRCVVCRGWCDEGLCAYCHARFAFTCERCQGCAIPMAGLAASPESMPAAAASSRLATEMAFLPDAAAGTRHCLRCRLSPPPWSRAIAGVDYGHPWDRLLADFKFHQRVDHAHVLLRPLLARLRACPPAGVRLVAVPLSRERLRERGYNQSWELARRLSRALELDARADALFRVRDTGHQLGLHREARSVNLRGAFVVSPRHAGWVRGASIALVDDVLTTGATAHAATRTLRAAGAEDVQVWVVARTPAS
jgi:ComF family protein